MNSGICTPLFRAPPWPHGGGNRTPPSGVCTPVGAMAGWTPPRRGSQRGIEVTPSGQPHPSLRGVHPRRGNGRVDPPRRGREEGRKGKKGKEGKDRQRERDRERERERQRERETERETAPSVCISASQPSSSFFIILQPSSTFFSPRNYSTSPRNFLNFLNLPKKLPGAHELYPTCSICSILFCIISVRVSIKTFHLSAHSS